MRVRSRGLMEEVARACQHESDARLVGGLDDLGLLLRSCRFDDCGDAGCRCLVDSVAEREERVGCENRPSSAIARLAQCDALRLDAAHLTRADADHLAA